MTERTVKALMEAKVKEPICLNCLSDEFSSFEAMQGQVLWCNLCYRWFRPEPLTFLRPLDQIDL